MKKRDLLLLLFVLTAFCFVNAQEVKYAINCGSDTAIADFVPDQYFVGGNTWSHAIFHPGYAADTTLIKEPAPKHAYTSLRYGTFSYVFPGLTPEADYTIRLHFADDYEEPNKRVQDVAINGATVLKNFDIFVASGKMKSVTREYNAKADAQGEIKIDFITVVDNALVTAIEIIEGKLEIDVFNTSEKPYLINSGASIDLGAFSHDALFDGGSTWSHNIFHPGYLANLTAITNPAPQDAYTELRYGSPFSYTFPDLQVDSVYTVRLHFADDYEEPNKRVQDIILNGDTVMFNYDIYVDAGKMMAVIKEFNVKPNVEGKIIVTFTKDVDQALINAIEIIQGRSELNYFKTYKKPYAVNCGSAVYEGRFSPDAYFKDGGSWTHTIFHPGYEADIRTLINPAPVTAYTSLRYGNPFSYVFPNLGTDSAYTVRLHFADDWGEPNKRMQDILINGDTVMFDFDLYTAAGKMKAVIREFNTSSDAEGNITIKSSASIDNGLISAIEIIKGVSEISVYNTYSNPYNINSGSDVNRGKFTPDGMFDGGSAWSHTIFHPGYEADTAGLTNPAPVEAYTTLRYGNPFTYTFTNLIADSAYFLRLHFADDWGEAGKRVQDISINGQQVLTNFDIYTQTGKMKGMIRHFNSVAKENGEIEIVFSATVDNALISAIEIFRGELDFTGIKEPSQTINAIIYPNPLQGDLLNVKIDEPSGVELTIMDMGGRLVLAKKLVSGNETITLNRQLVPAGNYIVCLRGKNALSYQKLIIF